MVRRSQIHGIALLLAAAATQACSGGKDNKCAVLAVPHTAGACYLADGRVALPDGGVLEEDELANAGLPTLDEARGSGKSAAADPVTASDEDAGSIEPSPSGDADAAVGEATDAEPSSAAESPGVDGGADHASDVVVDAAPPPECTQAAGCTAKEPVCRRVRGMRCRRRLPALRGHAPLRRLRGLRGVRSGPALPRPSKARVWCEQCL
jgi:hypothetical protein